MPRPRRILEIGAFEGRATCFMLEHLLPAEGGEIHCIDTWEGGAEHSGIPMDAVARRFRANVGAVLARLPQHQVVSHRGLSRHALGNLLAQGNAGRFDVLYVDGSHQAPDVLEDLVLGFRLCRVGALVICDDYQWQRQKAGQVDVLDTPKIAIDAFTTIYRRRVSLIDWPCSYQVAFRKSGD
ncbi:class I SAM-dependent methyltransferase [Neoroseomonas rubea]|uniref:class I SAM-dependent methyltransferase n=1 Tax=Neoroseomonas rubea TaxID=2748666 RepID=UPI0018E05BCF|nr:class I SAM-dependent methyltransferase [Roseomonas rubea]